MCVMNTSNDAKEVDFQKYMERTEGFSSAKNVVTDEKFSSLKKTSIPAMKMWVLELNK